MSGRTSVEFPIPTSSFIPTTRLNTIARCPPSTLKIELDTPYTAAAPSKATRASNGAPAAAALAAPGGIFGILFFMFSMLARLSSD